MLSSPSYTSSDGGLERLYYLLKFFAPMVDLVIQFRNAEFKTASLYSLNTNIEGG